MCKMFTKKVFRCIDCPAINANLSGCTKAEKMFRSQKGYPIPEWCPLPGYKNSINLEEKQNDQPTFAITRRFNVPKGLRVVAVGCCSSFLPYYPALHSTAAPVLHQTYLLV